MAKFGRQMLQSTENTFSQIFMYTSVMRAEYCKL